MCDSWSVDENLCMLYAVFKVMSVEQRNILMELLRHKSRTILYRDYPE